MRALSRRTLHPGTIPHRRLAKGAFERPAGPPGPTESPALLEEAKLAAILAYVPLLCIIALTRFRHDKFAFGHGVQGLILTVIELAVVMSLYFSKAILLLCLIMALVGVVFASQERKFHIPYLGEWIERL